MMFALRQRFARVPLPLWAAPVLCALPSYCVRTASTHANSVEPSQSASAPSALTHQANPYTAPLSTALYKPDPLNAFEEKWYWVLKAMRVYSSKAKVLVNSETIFRSIDEQATQNCVYEALGLPHDFATEHNLLTLHLWILHNRFKLDFNGSGLLCGRRVQEQVFERFWEDCVLKIRNVGIPEMSINKQLTNLQRVSFNSMMAYDDGIKAVDDDNMMLSAALWKHVFRENVNVDSAAVVLLSEYTRREVNSLCDVTVAPAQDLYHGWIPWGPVLGETVEDRLSRQRALFSGQWREAVHNDGRMYFFHTTTRMQQWEVPEEGLYPRRKYALLKHFERVELEGGKLPAGVHTPNIRMSPPAVTDTPPKLK